MSKYGNSYSGNSFLEWWKTHYGTDYDGISNISKTENMTEEDFAIGQTLLSNYQKAQKIESDFQESSNKLLENYTATKDTFDKNKRKSQQNASIMLDKLKKYLPTQIKAQGLGGLGVSESSMLQAHNNYSRDMGAIESEYAQKMSDLERAYGESVGNLESEKNNLLYYADKDENGNLLVNNTLNEYSEKRDKEFDENYDRAYETIINSGIKDESEMLTFIEQFRNAVDPSDWDSLVAEAKTVAGNNLKNSYPAQLTLVQDGLVRMQTDPTNYTSDGTKLTEKGRKKMLDYIEENRSLIGEDNYKILKSDIETMAYYSNNERNQSITTAINAFANNSNFNSQLSQYYEALNLLESHKGSLSTDEYNAYLSQITSGTRTDYTNYYVQGLGRGRNNDDVGITIGSTSRNRDTEFDLLCGDEVTNDSAKKLLNKLTTGTESVTPSEGKLCVVANRMYIYTSKGWRNVKPDNSTSALSNAISAFLTTGKSSGNTKPSEPVTYPSDSEISNKDQSGTLTYHDVAKYNSGIRTQSEFARGNNADKQKYGTYQNYLKAMYEKYKP